MKRSQWTLLFGLLVVALNLRLAIASVPPLIERIHVDLGLSYTALGLLTTIPTLCMGLFALGVPLVSQSIGRERGVFWGLVLVALATASRVGSMNVLVLFASTVLVGVGIAITQALLPPLVTEYFADRESFVTGLYTACLTIGAVVASGVTAPLSALVESWPAGLAVWAVLALVGLPIWYVSWRRGSAERAGTAGTATRVRIPWRDRWAWLLTGFFGTSSGAFFFVLTWLAPRYVAVGWSDGQAGLLLALFLLFQVGGNLGISAVGDRFDDHRPLFALMALLLIAGALGVAAAPTRFPVVWAALLGVGSAGLFTLSLTLPVRFTERPAEADGLTSMMLGGGYLIAALAPFLAGLLYDATGRYAIVFALLIALGVGLLGVGTLLAPDRSIPPTRRGRGR
jgi:CP family cyanate transporter-like MFS transporter